MNTVREYVKLAYQGGSSNKVYVIELIQVDERGFIVTAYNGRRGASLTPQPKITTPTSYSIAKREFNDLIDKKLNHPRTPYHIEEQHDNNRPAPQATASNSPSQTGRLNPPPAARVRAARETGKPASSPKDEEAETRAEEKKKRDRFDALEF